jgi:hypothetical protein
MKRRGFGNIRKLPSGRHQARYTTTTGVTITAPHIFPTKIAAEMWLTDQRRGIDASHIEPVKITFAAYAKTLLATRQTGGRPLKARTRDHYQSILDRELIPAFGSSQLSAEGRARRS